MAKPAKPPYDEKESYVDKYDVGILQHVLHADVRTPEMPYKNAIRLWITCGLKNHDPGYKMKELRPYATAIADIEIEVSQVTGYPAGSTDFELSEEEYARSKGDQKLYDIFKLIGTIMDYAVKAASLIPILGVLTDAIWKLVRSKPTKTLKQSDKLVIRHFKPWTFQAWHLMPVSIAEGFEVTFGPSMKVHTAQSISGPVTYKTKVKGRTGLVRIWRIDMTGEIENNLTFDIVWK